jgi:putative peptidoglycan lipid II flippase
VRAQVVNAVFGAGPALDAFNVAMRFPTVLRDLFAEGALSAAFTKALVDARTHHGPAAEAALTRLVTLAFGLVTLAISIGCAFAARPIIALLSADAFVASEGGRLAVACFAVLIFYLPIAMLSAVAMALLGARGQTFRATIASLFFNVGSIAGALAGVPVAQALGHDPILGLAVGTLLGGVLQFLFQLVPLWREGVFRLPGFSDLRWKGRGFDDTYARHPVLEMARLMAPRVLGQGAISIALFVNTHFATAAGPGAITYITNAQNIILVPVGLFGVASALASLPLLSSAVAEKDAVSFRKLLQDASRSTLWLSTFSVTALVLLAVPLAKGLLEHGRVTPQDSLMNGLAIVAYGLSILFNGVSKVSVQGYYALGDTRQIVLNSVLYLAVNATLSAWLAPKFGILGLGLSNCASAAASLALHLALLPRTAKKEGLFSFTLLGEKKFFGEVSLHVGVAASAVVFSLFVLQPWFTAVTHEEGWFTPWSALLLTAVGGGGLAVVWGACVWAWGPDDLKAVLQKVTRKATRLFQRR